MTKTVITIMDVAIQGDFLGPPNSQHGDWSGQDKSDDKQPPKWLPTRDQDKMAGIRVSGELQIPISNEGSKPEILSRIAQTTAALSREEQKDIYA